MKRIVTALLAAATFAAPMATGIAAADPPGRHSDRGHDRGGRGYDRDHRGGYDRRDDRRDDRWDSRRHNGYYYQNRWYYGPPPAAYYGRPGFRADYRQWRRGDYLPGYYREHYRAVDWRYYHLRPPPRGYHYVRDDRGGYLLVGITTGLILGAILSDY